MRLVTVRVTGFGRIRNSEFSADRKLTAVLGPNEAGKTSLLRALMSLNDEEPIPQRLRNRVSAIGDDQFVVEARYFFDETDREFGESRGWENVPASCWVKKTAGGRLIFEFDSTPRYPALIWASARSALDTFLRTVGDLKESDDLSTVDNEQLAVIRVLVDKLRKQIDKQSTGFTRSDLDSLIEAVGGQSENFLWLDDSDFQALVSEITILVDEPDLLSLMQSAIELRRPRFEWFTDADRELKHEYVIAEVEATVPRALSNLLALAGVTLSEILPDAGRRTAVGTAQDGAKDTLNHVFEHAWKQHPIEVRINFEPEHLILLVKDLGSGGQTIAFDERSDGLRTFVALTSFLASRGGQVPPILLIDEAEARLHWDAQADLVAVLQSATEVGQILYTTHSPGCLPPDLGTGIIFVQPDSSDPNLSHIRRDFWNSTSGESFGMAPLLFMMGAGAAAFSRLRRAVVTEGPSDMLLLPTLFRAATKRTELDFQIVPGISVTAKGDLGKLDDTGVRVAYLVDGDAQGKEWSKQLIDEGGVDKSRIRSLPDGWAAEDLFERDFYIDVFLKLVGRSAEKGKLSFDSRTLKPQLEELCRLKWKCEVPGAVEVAEAILGQLDSTSPGIPDHQRVPLAPNAGPALRDLHKQLLILLKPKSAPTR